MKKEYSKEEIEEVVREVEECYEEILRDDLVKAYLRFRIRTYHCAYKTLESTWLDLFDEDGKISRENLMGMKVEMQHRNCLLDEFGTVYFLPIESYELLDGQYIIERLLYYYCGKNKMERTILMRKLLADYLRKFREPRGSELSKPPVSSK